jgi:hypothetical protein
MTILCGWVLTMAGIIGIVSLPKDYVPCCTALAVMGASLMQGVMF